MTDTPKDLKYTETHEWVRIEDSSTIVVGITDTAQHLLGDLVFVELPELSSNVSAREECAVVESVKAASDVYSPLSGEVIEVNDQLESNPELINQDPYGNGWIFKLRPTNLDAEVAELLDAEDYQTKIAADE